MLLIPAYPFLLCIRCACAIRDQRCPAASHGLPTSTDSLRISLRHVSSEGAIRCSSFCCAKPSYRIGQSSNDPDRKYAFRARHATSKANTYRVLSVAETAGNGVADSKLSRRRILTVFQLCAISFWASFTTGTVTVGLTTIAQETNLPTSLFTWPSSVLGLTSGATLLIAGAIADVVGPFPVEILGSLLVGVWTLASGFVNSGTLLVVFRAGQGVALAMHLPASVALISEVAPQGRARNLGFACLGLSQPLGFSFGLVLSGVMIETIGWRSCFFLSGGAGLVAAITGFLILPRSSARARSPRTKSLLEAFLRDVDWVGGLLASGGFALLAYTLAILSSNPHALRDASGAVIFSIGLLLLVLFPFWMHRREKRGKPALVPNKIWKRSHVC